MTDEQCVRVCVRVHVRVRVYVRVSSVWILMVLHVKRSKWPQDTWIECVGFTYKLYMT